MVIFLIASSFNQFTDENFKKSLNKIKIFGYDKYDKIRSLFCFGKKPIESEFNIFSMG